MIIPTIENGCFQVSLHVPEQRESPPELSEEKQALQEEADELKRAKVMLLDAQEIVRAYGYKSMVEDLEDFVHRVSTQIWIHEDKINAPEGERER